MLTNVKTTRLERRIPIPVPRTMPRTKSTLHPRPVEMVQGKIRHQLSPNISPPLMPLTSLSLLLIKILIMKRMSKWKSVLSLEEMLRRAEKTPSMFRRAMLMLSSTEPPGSMSQVLSAARLVR